MTMIAQLLHILEQAQPLSATLEAALGVIAQELRVDGCSLFFCDPKGELVQGAAYGPSDPESDTGAHAMAASVLATKRTLARRAAHSQLASPMLVRGRLVGVLVLRASTDRDYSPEEVATLGAICAQLVGFVEKARIADSLSHGTSVLGRAPVGAPGLPGAPGAELVLQGVGASPGIAIGTAVFRRARRLDPRSEKMTAGAPATERARVRTAIEKTRNDLMEIQKVAEREIDEEHALIFAAHLLVLSDTTFLSRVDREIDAGASAPLALDAALDDFERQLRLVEDAYIQERIDDIDDLRGRLLDHVLEPTSRARFGTRTVVSNRVPPSLVVELKTEGARGLVTEIGGATSHGVLLARAMGLPVVTGVADMLAVADTGDLLVLDGGNGVIVVRPTPATLAHYEAELRHAEALRTEHGKFRGLLAQTADGVRVTLQANIGISSDLSVARENGAEGIGLYRTEFPFIVRDAFPSVEEQVKIYRRAYEVFPDSPINFRVLDLGGDKFVTTGSLAVARNAFHGYRSLRVLFDHPAVLQDQVRALALAAGDRPLRILIPMVTSLEDLQRAKALIAEALSSVGAQHEREAKLGAMIEVPAAVEIARDIAEEVDFLSIGTNDLMQYTLVVDREDARMAPRSDPYHPAILRMLGRVVEAARAAGTPIGVCGEIAARPDIALALIALGVDSLSVAPTSIPELKQALAASRIAPMRDAMPTILTLSSSRLVTAALRRAQLE